MEQELMRDGIEKEAGNGTGKNVDGDEDQEAVSTFLFICAPWG